MATKSMIGKDPLINAASEGRNGGEDPGFPAGAVRDQALLSVSGMYRADARTIENGTPGITLMENAGRAVVEEIRARYRPGTVTVLCGPGNNGGDGFVVARHLRGDGWNVRLGLLGSLEKLKGDARTAAGRWCEIAGADAVEVLDVDLLEAATLVVDALFGAGLDRAMEGAPAECLAEASGRGIPIVSVDMPSGVSGDSGRNFGGAQEAALTVTFFRAKPGHYLLPGRCLSGEVVVRDIGISADVFDEIGAGVLANDPVLWRGLVPRLKPEDHKYSRGHVLIVAGSDMMGASRLSARAAQRSGVGMVSIAAPTRQAPLYRLALESAVVHDMKDTRSLIDLLETGRFDAVLIGPGLGLLSPGGLEKVLAVLRSGLPCVLDADAISYFESDPDLLFRSIAGPTVLTPHEGEFRRIFPDLAAEQVVPEEADGETPPGKPGRALAAARRAGCCILLKGFDTVIANIDGPVLLNHNAPPDLASAGAGDVLAGILCGLLARGMAPLSAAGAAAWMHGETGRAAGFGLIASDLPDLVPRAMAAALEG